MSTLREAISTPRGKFRQRGGNVDTEEALLRPRRRCQQREGKADIAEAIPTLASCFDIKKATWTLRRQCQHQRGKFRHRGGNGDTEEALVRPRMHPLCWWYKTDSEEEIGSPSSSFKYGGVNFKRLFTFSLQQNLLRRMNLLCNCTTCNRKS